MNPAHYIRQTNLIDPAKLVDPIAIVGAGGIGSWTTLALAKMGCRSLTVFDFDVVDPGNVGPQIYSEHDIGKPKVEALQAKIPLIAEGTGVEAIQDRIENQKARIQKYNLVISAVDNMEIRKAIFEMTLKNQTLIDGRMGGNAIELYTVPGNNPEARKIYNKTLFTQEKARELKCGERAVVYNTFIISGLIADVVAHLANGKEVPALIDVDLQNFSLYI